MLTLTFLGVGSAFAKRNYQSNVLLEFWSQSPGQSESPEETLLIDFGTAGPRSLYKLGKLSSFSYLSIDGQINYRAIDRVFITHLHADHIGGLEELSLLNQYKFADRETSQPYRPELISSAEILEDLWAHSLKGGLVAQMGRSAVLEDYFRLLPIQVDGKSIAFTMGGRYEFRVFRTDHIRIQVPYDWPTCGVTVTDSMSGKSVMYSGDTRFEPDVFQKTMQDADIIFQDCQLVETPVKVHARVNELRTLSETIRKKMILYHYEDIWDMPTFRFVDEEFVGFATPHHRYDLFGDNT